MSEKKKYIESFNNGEPPLQIPSPDLAWADMKSRLEKDGNRRTMPWTWLGFASLILLSGIILLPYLDRNTGEASGKIENGMAYKRHKEVNMALPGTGNNHGSSIGALSALEEKNPGKNVGNNRFSGIRKFSKIGSGLHSVPVWENKEKSAKEEQHTFKAPGFTQGRDSAADITVHNKSRAEETNVTKGASAIPVVNNDQKADWEGGLQWTLPIAFQGTDIYFSGPKGSAQPYRLLIPAIYLSVQNKDHSGHLVINPFATRITDGGMVKQTETRIDSVTTQSDIENLSKVFGLTIELNYGRKISGNWWGGFGLRSSLWKKGVVRQQTVISTGISPTDPSPVKQSMESLIAMDDEAKESVNMVQFGPVVQLLYKKPKWQSGLQLNYTLPPLVKENDNNSRLHAEMFFRLPIISKRH